MLGWLTQGRALARYRLNRIILHCGSAFFHLSQLHMGQRKGVNTPGLEVPVRLSPLLFTAVVRAWFRLFLLLRRHRLRSLRRIFRFRLRLATDMRDETAGAYRGKRLDWTT